MLCISQFEKIKEKYGSVASWAVWDTFGEKPKSNIGNMDVFEISKNNNLLQTLKPNVVMVGLNFSREVKFEKPFMNFHDSSPFANDFKIRYAFHGTSLYGAYMTDIIKNLEMKSSKDVLTHLEINPHVTQENITAFRRELLDIGSVNPIILAFGRGTFGILRKNMHKNEYSHLVKLTHYSHQISKEDYKKDVLLQLHNAGIEFTAS